MKTSTVVPSVGGQEVHVVVEKMYIMYVYDHNNDQKWRLRWRGVEEYLSGAHAQRDRMG